MIQFISMVIELERTFLLKYLPFVLSSKEFKDCIDIYLPINSKHPHLRIRKIGNIYEMTKKQPVKDDSSEQSEQTIILSEDEFKDISKIRGLLVHKHRYVYKIGKVKAELDVFQDNLLGLILIDFEFNSVFEKNNFVAPDFCLAEVTQEEFIAGGYLAGKKFQDITKQLKKYGYKFAKVSL